MSRSSFASSLPLVRPWLAVAGCLSFCLTSISGISGLAQQPATMDKPPARRLLTWTEVEKKIQDLSKIPVKDCTSGDLTINGLARLANKHLQQAGRSERVLMEAVEDVGLEEMLQHNFFSPLFETKAPLDKEDLVRQINSGTLNDLLMNLPVLCNNSMRWFEGAYVCIGASPSVDPLMHHARPKLYTIRAAKPPPRHPK